MHVANQYLKTMAQKCD